LRILYHHRLGSKDGQYVHVEELVAALRRLGHEVLVVGPAVAEAEGFGGASSTVGRLKRHVPRAAYELLELGYSVFAHRRLARAARRFAPDVLYERYNLHSFAGAWLARRLGLPFLLEVNAPLAEERHRYGGLGLPGLARRTEAGLWRRADTVVTVTHVLADMIAAAGVPRERVLVTPNGVDPARLAALPDAATAKQSLGLAGRRVVGFTGFMREWHGLDRLVDWLAAEAPTDVVLWLVGDGPARSGLEARAARLGVADRVTITGVVPRDRVLHHVRAFDVAVQPDVVAYASPLKLIEYMALGVAIVAPDAANIRELLSDDGDAVLTTPEAVPEAVGGLLQDEPRRQRLAAAAARTWQRRTLTWDANAERVVARFATLRAAPHPAGDRAAMADHDRAVRNANHVQGVDPDARG
jgi:glycosyltransferase involved in cell wall biosynthesis